MKRSNKVNKVVRTCVLWLSYNLIYLCSSMNFYDKYPVLKKREYLITLLTESVFASMSLENQILPKPKVQEIVISVLKEHAKKQPTHHS